MPSNEPRLRLHDLIMLLVAPVPPKRGRGGEPAATTPWLSMREAMPVAGKLFAHGDVTYTRLSGVSDPLLVELGITSPEARRQTIAAIRAALDNPEWTIKLRRSIESSGPGPTKQKRTFNSKAMATVGNATAPRSATTSGTPPRKRRRSISPETLARDWGDPTWFSSPTAPEVAKQAKKTFSFNEVFDLYALRGRTVLVNRAPVLTAWSTVVLEKMGFERDEALSLAHCYVSHTSTARGMSIGVLPDKGPGNRPLTVGVGTNQPHFELMGVKIPVMQVHDSTTDVDHDVGDESTQKYRGISQGQMVAPDKAYDYLKSSMMMQLPFVMGAMHLLADAFTEDGPGDPDPQRLERAAWRLYVEFRPDTGGEWGKRGSLSINKILLLRPGHEPEQQDDDTKSDEKQKDTKTEDDTKRSNAGNDT